ncbi:carbonic anhydrase [Streptomyces sp. NEAU-NA10]|uniref:carbonic anhydrase n=1 Tax=Streptomyces sp. NEAU-NA10 TaxID=3416050 RepID=UPI003CC64C98
MGNAGHAQRRTLLTGGLVATAALITGCSSKSDGTATQRTTVAGAAAKTASPSANTRPDSPSAAFARLMEGNRRWVDGKLQHPGQDPSRRKAVAEKQEPYGVILSCIDSRVPPELVFDTGLGDLFVLRTGGQVVAPVVTGSVEYGPLTSGTPLVVVLGHQRCGAVKAAYEAMRDGKELPGTLPSIAHALRPAYRATLRKQTDDPVDAMIRIHAEQTAEDLRANKALAPLIKKGELAVVSAYYSLDTGRVETLTGAPSA